jgi:hypothetical protein
LRQVSVKHAVQNAAQPVVTRLCYDHYAITTSNNIDFQLQFTYNITQNYAEGAQIMKLPIPLSLKRRMEFCLGLLLAVIWAMPVFAHHNTQAEYGAFDSDFIHVEGTITDIKWGNPHLAFTIIVTGGDLPAAEIGKSWQVNSHPINTMIDYGFTKEEFKVGDKLKLLTWRHVRGIRHLWPRALQVNDGPFKSNLRYTDMIDIANGTFAALGIQPAANLNGSSPFRAGTTTVKKLGELGLLDADGNMIWPAP